MPIIRLTPEDGKDNVAYRPETGSDFAPIPETPAPNFYAADFPGQPDIQVYYDQETDIELLLSRDGQSLTIRAGRDRLELSGREWRGLYSGMMNVGPGRTQ